MGETHQHKFRKSVNIDIPHNCIQTVPTLLLIINWMVQALNADWLTGVVYQTVYHGYDKTLLLLL